MSIHTITLKHQHNGTLASAMIKDSAGEYLFEMLYQGYDDETVREVFQKRIAYQEMF